MPTGAADVFGALLAALNPGSGAKELKLAVEDFRGLSTVEKSTVASMFVSTEGASSEELVSMRVLCRDPEVLELLYGICEDPDCSRDARLRLFTLRQAPVLLWSFTRSLSLSAAASPDPRTEACLMALHAAHAGSLLLSSDSKLPSLLGTAVPSYYHGCPTAPQGLTEASLKTLSRSEEAPRKPRPAAASATPESVTRQEVLCSVLKAFNEAMPGMPLWHRLVYCRVVTDLAQADYSAAHLTSRFPGMSGERLEYCKAMAAAHAGPCRRVPMSEAMAVECLTGLMLCAKSIEVREDVVQSCRALEAMTAYRCLPRAQAFCTALLSLVAQMDHDDIASGITRPTPMSKRKAAPSSQDRQPPRETEQKQKQQEREEDDEPDSSDEEEESSDASASPDQ